MLDGSCVRFEYVGVIKGQTRKVDPPPFIMISYTQTWCKNKWSRLAKELERLQASGWVYVWLDVLVMDKRYAYDQATFEKAMRFALEQSDAVYCPMSTSYHESLVYLKRPWCNYECCQGMERKKFYINHSARALWRDHHTACTR